MHANDRNMDSQTRRMCREFLWIQGHQHGSKQLHGWYVRTFFVLPKHRGVKRHHMQQPLSIKLADTLYDFRSMGFYLPRVGFLSSRFCRTFAHSIGSACCDVLYFDSAPS